MKKITFVALFASLLGLGTAQAADVAQPFTVQASVTAQCATTHPVGTPPVLDFGTVPAFTAATGSVDVTFKCTRNSVGPTAVALDASSGNVAGLGYSLTVGSPTVTAGAAASGGTGAGADLYKYTVSGSIAAGQAGDTGASTTSSRTLTITY